jgi:hypothetical protein
MLPPTADMEKLEVDIAKQVTTSRLSAVLWQPPAQQRNGQCMLVLAVYKQPIRDSKAASQHAASPALYKGTCRCLHCSLPVWWRNLNSSS